MKLLKLSEEHYIVADKCLLDIKVGDWITDKYSVWQWKDDCSLLGRLKVTHSTEPLEDVGLNTSMGWQLGFDNIKGLHLSKVKELLGVVDVESRTNYYSTITEETQRVIGYVLGYNQSLEDNKEKKYTEEDVHKALSWGYHAAKDEERGIKSIGYGTRFIQSLQPKTEWEIEIIDGKLKLKQ